GLVNLFGVVHKSPPSVNGDAVVELGGEYTDEGYIDINIYDEEDNWVDRVTPANGPDAVDHFRVPHVWGVWPGSVWQYGEDEEEEEEAPPPCPPIIPGRVRRLEIWDDTVANGGQRQAFIPEWSEVRFTRELDGREFVRVEMPRLSKAFPYITEQAVLRTVYEDLTWEEWRI